MLYIWYDPIYTLEPKLKDYWKAIASLVIGTVIYIYRMPERWSKTGTFDLIFSSHQIMHCMVLVAIYFTFEANKQLYEERLAFVCPS